MIADHIPYGKKNAVTREYLCNVTGLKDRDVREMISKERRNTPILSSGKGYFQPTEDETAEVAKWVIQESKRARSIFWSMWGAKAYLKLVPDIETLNKEASNG